MNCRALRCLTLRARVDPSPRSKKRADALRKAAHIVEQDPDAYADRHTADQFVAWITTRHPVHDPVAYIQKLADDRAIAPLLEAMYAETDA